jgi:hypothetical protein
MTFYEFIKCWKQRVTGVEGKDEGALQQALSMKWYRSGASMETYVPKRSLGTR